MVTADFTLLRPQRQVVFFSVFFFCWTLWADRPLVAIQLP
jgi:hypothetical protein